MQEADIQQRKINKARQYEPIDRVRHKIGLEAKLIVGKKNDRELK